MSEQFTQSIFSEESEREKENMAAAAAATAAASVWQQLQKAVWYE